MAKAPTKKALISTLRTYFENGEREVYLNLINLGAAGPILRQMLKDAGYTTKDEGCPQQTWTLDEAVIYAEREMRRMKLENENVPDYSNRGQYGGPNE